MARTSINALFCMAGTTLAVAILAVLRIPQTTFFIRGSIRLRRPERRLPLTVGVVSSPRAFPGFKELRAVRTRRLQPEDGKTHKTLLEPSQFGTGCGNLRRHMSKE